MSLARGFRVSCVFLAVAGIVALSGCSTPAPQRPPPAPVAPAPETAEILQARFDRLVQELLEVEPRLAGLLDQIAAAMDKPSQAAVERELLRFLTGDAFAAALEGKTFFTAGSLLQQFAPKAAEDVKAARLEQPILKIVDDLARLARAIKETAAVSEDGRALERIFALVHRDVLPALVETRALVTEELLDTNEASALAQKVEEQLQSINDQLGSLKSRARSVSSPSPLP